MPGTELAKLSISSPFSDIFNFGSTFPNSIYHYCLECSSLLSSGEWPQLHCNYEATRFLGYNIQLSRQTVLNVSQNTCIWEITRHIPLGTGEWDFINPIINFSQLILVELLFHVCVYATVMIIKYLSRS